MRKDPTSQIIYQKSVQIIEETLNLNLKIVPLLNVSKKELENFIQIGQKYLLNFIKGFYFSKYDTIYIVDGNEEDLQLFVHETLHSNSIFDYNNSPLWIREGLTKALTEKILKENEFQISIDFYLEKEKDFWLEKLKKDQSNIIRAYFGKNLDESVNILSRILKTEKNVLEMSFYDYLKEK